MIHGKCVETHWKCSLLAVTILTGNNLCEAGGSGDNTILLGKASGFLFKSESLALFGQIHLISVSLDAKVEQHLL